MCSLSVDSVHVVCWPQAPALTVGTVVGLAVQLTQRRLADQSSALGTLVLPESIPALGLPTAAFAEGYCLLLKQLL